MIVSKPSYRVEMQRVVWCVNLMICHQTQLGQKPKDQSKGGERMDS